MAPKITAQWYFLLGQEQDQQQGALLDLEQEEQQGALLDLGCLEKVKIDKKIL